MKRSESFLRKPRFWFSLAISEQIRASIGSTPAESGGMIGGDPKRGIVTHLFLDSAAVRTATTYAPDIETVNEVLQEWNAIGVRLLGFVHSHPPGLLEPSPGDRDYAKRILEVNPELRFLLLPIIESTADAKKFSMHLFVARRDGDGISIRRAQLLLFEDEPGSSEIHQTQCEFPFPLAPHLHETARNFHIPFDRSAFFSAPQSSSDGPSDESKAFERVRTAYDLDHLRQWCVVGVGVGGAGLFYEHLARAGIGRFLLIDPDVYAPPNLATQHCYANELGQPKVECVAARIKQIRRRASVVTRQLRLDDLDDAAFTSLLLPEADQFPPTTALLCGCTDNFFAQARVNRLALQFGLPAILSQVYERGVAAELVWMHPASSRACARCILSARYKAYLNGGFSNTTGAGAPIYATLRLNALETFLALALMHHGRSHPRWGNIITRLGSRQLVQVRCDPDADSALGFQNFSGAFSGVESGQVFSDESIWRPQLPECPETGYPPCPDCGGNPRGCVGKFTDTRTMPPQS